MNIVRFYHSIYRDNRLRIDHRRNLLRDIWLYAKNRTLQPLEIALANRYYSTTWPLVFIVGVPRSGSTLLYQLMSQYLEIGYITNFASRYWLAPLYSMIRHRGRHRDDDKEIKLTSSLGATEGLDAPHEFGYFWRFWLDIAESDHLSDEQLDRVDWKSIRRELYSLAGWFQSPLVLKNLNFSTYHIDRFAREFPNCRFIYIRRNVLYLVQSLLESRVRRYGNRQSWFGTRPRDIEQWRDREPLEQINHQIRDIECSIDSALTRLPTSAFLQVDYHQLVKSPQNEVERIGSFIRSQIRDPLGLSKLQLDSANTLRLSHSEQEAVERFIGTQEAAS